MVRPDQLYSQARTQRTQRQLSSLDMFRFNTLSYRKVEEDGRAPEGPATADSSRQLGPTPAARRPPRRACSMPLLRPRPARAFRKPPRAAAPTWRSCWAPSATCA
ncbi:MAG: hypothetical protein WKG07_34175 [Hymenobacter sp.]